MSLGDILHFISGASKLPAAGFNKAPSIHFTDSCDALLPTTSTCDISITFPRSYGKLTPDEFKKHMDMCIMNSFGFGGP